MKQAPDQNPADLSPDILREKAALFPGMPADEAAAAAVAPRVRSVQRLLRRALKAGPENTRLPHRLRVATRRASAAAEAFGAALDADLARKIVRRLKKIRRLAGDVRNPDVMGALLTALAEHAPPDQRTVLDRIFTALRADRQAAFRRLVDLSENGIGRRLKASTRRLLAPAPSDAPTALDLAHTHLHAAADAALAALAASGDLPTPESLHAVRLACKKLRYSLELFEPLLPEGARERWLPSLVAVQERLGSANDAAMVVDLFERHAAVPDGDSSTADPSDAAGRRWLRAMADGHRAVRDMRLGEAVAALGSSGVADAARAIQAWARPAPDLNPSSPGPHEPANPAADAARSHAPAGGRNGALHAPATPRLNGSANGSATHDRPPIAPPAPRDIASPARDDSTRPRTIRLAAIDAGSNSIRLLVVEAHEDGSYRVLDDEREVARLGAGLAEAGLMHGPAMERAADAIARMRGIAEGYGASALRLIGTSACRDAANIDRFRELVREKSDLDLEVIDPQEEGRLAHLSAAHTFDLHGVTSAVIDIGGGSTEIVLSAGSITENIYSLPLGAVRLTEMFGGPDDAAGRRYDDLRRHVRRTLRREVGKPVFAPQLAIGTGGTFTTLANILLQRGPDGPSLWDRGVPGFEAKRSEVSHLIDRLRAMTPRQRAAEVPGLPAERADIIVPGLVVVERVLKLLRVNTVRVHDRGVRDGLIIRMIGEHFGGGQAAARASADPMRVVRRFAESCGYEADHSEHVTALSMAIFDDLAARGVLSADDVATPLPRQRLLLEAAGVLHDIGYLINYSKHHRHSYHLIVHSDFAPAAGFSRREADVIANVARYHRRGEPKLSDPEFAALEQKDRELVRRLAAVLRVADGLDRTHTRNVREVRLHVQGRTVLIEGLADRDPVTDLWGSSRKSRLFERVFGVRVKHEWRRTNPRDLDAAAGAAPEPVHDERAASHSP